MIRRTHLRVEQRSWTGRIWIDDCQWFSSQRLMCHEMNTFLLAEFQKVVLRQVTLCREPGRRHKNQPAQQGEETYIVLNERGREKLTDEVPLD